MIKIPWAQPSIGKEELDEVTNSFKTKWLTMGPKVKKFEEEMAAYVSALYGIAVTNGTIALDIVLKTLGIGPGDEVIVPAMTYFATAAAVSYQHAVPVFVDIESNSFNLDAKRIPEAITEKTKAIIFIDYGGNPSDFDSIAKVGKEYSIPVIQDAAQSLGAVYKGVSMGAQTDISTMSFHMAKVMTCVEGGMIFTQNEKYKDEILARRNQGEAPKAKYLHSFLGTNARMTDIQAGIGLAQLKKLPDLLNSRKKVAAKYDELFAKKDVNVRTAQTLTESSKNSYFFYPILIDNRNRIASALRTKYGIDTRIAYSMPVYKQEVYALGRAKCRYIECPVAERITSKILNLPIFYEMKDSEIEYVVNSIIKEIKN